MTISVSIYIWIFDSVSLIKLYVFMPKASGFYYYSSVVQLEIRDGDTSGYFFITYRIVLAVLGFFIFFHVKLYNVLSRSVENCARILMGISLNLYITFG